MIVTVFGASGKVGRLVVTEALARGYTVRGFIHSHNPLDDHPNLTVITGDIHEAESVAMAIQGSQAVISALGSWGTSSKDIVSTGMRHIIPAMEAYGVDRIVSLTGADAFDVNERPSLLRRCSHEFARLVAGNIVSDGEEHLRLLRASDLDWTVLRAPVMTNSSSIFYKLSLKPLSHWQTIPRKAVAKAMIDQVDGSTYSKAAPFLYRY